MSNDATPIRLTQFGTVEIPPEGPEGMIVITGFEGENCTCRDVAIMACAWAIGRLQREMLKSIEKPGGGNTGIG